MRFPLGAAAFAAACLVVPAQAQEHCLTVEKLLSLLEENGGKVVGGAEYAGTASDLVLIYAVNGAVLMAIFNHGCAAGSGPIKIDDIAPDKEVPQHFQSPALKAPKAEVGA